MRNLEHLIAVTLTNWWAYEANRRELDPRLLFAIPNGGARHIRTAKKLKAEGVRAGIPDYFLAVPREPHAGLFLELKTETGRTSGAQDEMLAVLNNRGYRCAVAKGIEEATREIESYLGPPPRRM
jgi:hypothetical protein